MRLQPVLLVELSLTTSSTPSVAAVFAIIAFTTFVTGSLAGLYNIWTMMAFIQAVCLFAVIVLRIWNVPDNLKWAAYFLLGFMGAPNPLFFG